MSEPYNDEELEQAKKEYDNGGWMGFCPSSEIDRLFATVESLKEKNQHALLYAETRDEENAKLKESRDTALARCARWFDENATLRAEKETSIYDYAYLRRELDAALKRIEEIE